MYMPFIQLNSLGLYKPWPDLLLFLGLLTRTNKKSLENEKSCFSYWNLLGCTRYIINVMKGECCADVSKEPLCMSIPFI